MDVFLSLAVYAGLCLAISRIFIRTGHSMVWVLIAFIPFALIAMSYALWWFQVLPELSRGILTFVVLVYLAILAILSIKSWPADRRGSVKVSK